MDEGTNRKAEQDSAFQAGPPRKKARWRRRAFWIFVLALFIPIPMSNGLWLPILFVFFDWMNQFLPENF
jgi:hypothetical protein